MGSEWEMRPLGELADLHQEQVNPADFPGQLFEHYSLPAFDAGQIPVREAGSSIGSQKFTVPRDAILLSKLNPRIPRVWKPEVASDLPAVASTEFLVLLPKDRIDRAFLKYACLSPSVREELQARVTGTSGSHQRVRPDDALTIEISIPVDPGEQRAIAHILGTLDDKIELNRKMNETLEAMARAIFKSWFVDFDPVRAKMEGRWKKGESLPGLPAELWDLFPSEFEESEIGKIPKGWGVHRLVEEATFVRGVSYRSEDLAESQTALVSLKCAGREGVYHEEGLKPYRGEFKEDQIVQPGDVVVSHTDVTQRAEVIGRAYRVRPSPQFSRLVASLDMAIVRPKGESETREYLAHSLSTERFIDHAYGYTNGTTVLHLSSQALPDYPHLVPPISLVGKFTAIVSPLHGKVGECGLESNTLSKTRDTLLPKLLSGEIRVPIEGGH
jgi:type I restriction enzyme S subunit